MIEEKVRAGFQLKKVSLSSSNFRVKNGSYEPPKNLSLTIDRKWRWIEDNLVTIILAAIVQDKDDENAEEFFISATYSGFFEFKEKPAQVKKEDFCNFNGPAIIYPYIRKHIRDLTLEANFSQPIILPVLNFTKFEKIEEN